jgi:hypothetical protein
MATDKRQFTLRLQDETYDKISGIAKKERRSIAMQIEHVLIQFIQEFEEKHGLVEVKE